MPGASHWRLDMISIDKIINSDILYCLDSDFCWSNIKYIDSIDYRILYDECYEDNTISFSCEDIKVLSVEKKEVH